jgi:hypothetical protein
MPFGQIDDPILKDRLKLYDNIAHSGDCVGRLSAEFQIYPSPSIVWEFECLGEGLYTTESADFGQRPLIGQGISIHRPIVTSSGGSGHVFRGIATQACLGRIDDKASLFRFYLPNACFQEENVSSQGVIEKHLELVTKTGIRSQIYWGTEGRVTDGSVGNGWSIRLETRQEALDWLRRGRTGTYITTVGSLHPTAEGTETEETLSQCSPVTISQALERLSTIRLLLSYANGGYTGPLIVEALGHNEIPVSTMITVYETTPIEQIGRSWLAHDSDFAMYLDCCPALERMLSQSLWVETLPAVLLWYFQAIQPQNAQMRGKPWPVVANSVGAALERLSYAILVREANIRGLKNNKSRVGSLLKHIGVHRDRGHWDAGFTDAFVDIRDEATHPQPGSLKSVDRDYLLGAAIQWIDEVLLWRLGYCGSYQERRGINSRSIKPRYHFRNRPETW